MNKSTRHLVVALMLTALTGCTKSDETAALKDDSLSQLGTKGQVVLLEFGQVGCEVSEAGMLKMKSMCKDNAIPGLSFVRIEESAETTDIKEYFDENDLPFPVNYDPDHATATELKANTYPCFVLLDKHGRVRYRGSFPSDELAEWVATLNKEKSDAGPDAPLFGVETLNIPEILANTKLPELPKNTEKALADYAGENGLVVIFVDTSCPFAGEIIKEMPGVSKTMSKHKMPVVLINTDQPADVVKKFYAQTETGTPVIYDTTAATHSKWGVDSVPTVFVISSSEALLYNGPAVWETISAAIEKGLDLPAHSVTFVEEGTAYG